MRGLIMWFGSLTNMLGLCPKLAIKQLISNGRYLLGNCHIQRPNCLKCALLEAEPQLSG